MMHIPPCLQSSDSYAVSGIVLNCLSHSRSANDAQLHSTTLKVCAYITKLFVIAPLLTMCAAVDVLFWAVRTISIFPIFQLGIKQHLFDLAAAIALPFFAFTMAACNRIPHPDRPPPPHFAPPALPPPAAAPQQPAPNFPLPAAAPAVPQLPNHPLPPVAGPANPTTYNMWHAARGGDYDRVKQLLDLGVPCHSDDGLDPLDGSIDHPRIFQLMLDRGAEPLKRNFVLLKPNNPVLPTLLNHLMQPKHDLDAYRYNSTYRTWAIIVAAATDSLNTYSAQLATADTTHFIYMWKLIKFSRWGSSLPKLSEQERKKFYLKENKAVLQKNLLSNQDYVESAAHWNAGISLFQLVEDRKCQERMVKWMTQVGSEATTKTTDALFKFFAPSHPDMSLDLCRLIASYAQFDPPS